MTWGVISFIKETGDNHLEFPIDYPTLGNVLWKNLKEIFGQPNT